MARLQAEQGEGRRPEDAASLRRLSNHRPSTFMLLRSDRERRSSAIRPQSRKKSLLPMQFTGKSRADRALTFRVGCRQEAYAADPFVVPAGIVGDRVEAYALDRDAGLQRSVHFRADVVEPSRSAATLRAGLGNEKRAPVARMHFTEHLVQRSIRMMAHGDRRTVMVPLIIGIVVEPDDIEIFRRSTQFRLLGAAQKIEHYEIASYGTMVALAKAAGQQDLADLLAETLQEEKQTDEKLTQLAERELNPAAIEGAPSSEPTNDRRGKRGAAA